MIIIWWFVCVRKSFHFRTFFSTFFIILFYEFAGSKIFSRLNFYQRRSLARWCDRFHVYSRKRDLIVSQIYKTCLELVTTINLRERWNCFDETVWDKLYFTRTYFSARGDVLYAYVITRCEPRLRSSYTNYVHENIANHFIAIQRSHIANFIFGSSNKKWKKKE